MVMHHGVAGGTLSPVEYDLYKLRYDERTTPNPLYCPVPTCSTFIPPRLLDPSKTSIDCTICTTRICTTCKQIAEPDHRCEDNETIAKIKALNYKSCPKCGTGIQKMYGCPHVRCACGAHFCWDCSRAINICYKNPCASAREEGQYGEGEDYGSESDEEVDSATRAALLQEALAQIEGTGAPTTPARPTIMQRVTGLVNAVRRRHSEPQIEPRGEPNQEVHSCPIEPDDLIPRERTAAAALVDLSAGQHGPVAMDDGIHIARTRTEPLTSLPVTPLMFVPADWMLGQPGGPRPSMMASQDEPNYEIIPCSVEAEVELASSAAAPIAQSEDTSSSSVELQNTDSQIGTALVLTRHDEQPAQQNYRRTFTTQREAMLAAYEVRHAGEDSISMDEFSRDDPNRLTLTRVRTRNPNENPDPLPSPAPYLTTYPDTPPLTTTPTAVLESIPEAGARAGASTGNLDDPDRFDWEAEGCDFGEEPSEETYDVWGCVCNFTRLKQQDVDLEHWMQDPKYLECMKCFESVELLDLPTQPDQWHDEEKRVVKKMKKGEQLRLAWNCMKCGVVVCGACRDQKVKELKSGAKLNQAHSAGSPRGD